MLQVVAVLIIDCPYALGLATLMSVMVDSSRAATSGVLFRDADAFETLRRVDMVIVDKTGTVTLGKPVCQIAEAVAPLRNKELQRLPASPDEGSERPLAKAIVAAAHAQQQAVAKPSMIAALAMSSSVRILWSWLVCPLKKGTFAKLPDRTLALVSMIRP